MLVFLTLFVLFVAHAHSAGNTGEVTKRPNVVVFIMDDIGMGDLGCFGNDTMQTPHIDALAAEGAILTQHIALPLCTPSRAALMTGRYPVRYGMASRNIMRIVPFISSKTGLPPNETTYAEMLKDEGYATALIGACTLCISMATLCEECEDEDATVACVECELKFCDRCDAKWHATTTTSKDNWFQKHKREQLKKCEVCTSAPATLHCSDCRMSKWHIGTNCDSEGCSDPIGQGFDYYYGIPLTNLRDCRGDSNVFIAWDRHIYRDIFITYVLLLWASYALKKRNTIGRPGFVILFMISSILCGGFYAFIQGIKMMNCIILENRKVVEQPFTYDNLADRMSQRAVNFLEMNHDKPFMLTMSFIQAHTALFSSDRFTNRSKHGPYGDAVEEMDHSLGEVTSTLKRLGLDKNTFIYLTSDNGGHVEEHTEDDVREGGWNGIYKGSKGSSYEGGIRVPTIVTYPGVVPAGIEVSEATHITDALATIADVVGIPLPEDRIIDGKSMIPLLTAKKTVSEHEFMYHYCGTYMHGVRYRPRTGSTSYKVVFSTVRHFTGPHGVEGCFNTFACQCSGSSMEHHDPPLVYDITNDPSEVTPLNVQQPLVQDILNKVNTALDNHRGTLTNVPYQFSVLRMLPRPWAQPCCGVFPFCSCSEPSYEAPNMKSLEDDLKHLPPPPVEEQMTPST